MPRYELREQGTVFNTVVADDADGALDQVELSYSDYSGNDDEPSTVFVEIAAVNADDSDDSGCRTFTLDPEEPTCPAADEHDWQSPVEIVGGLKENPGVHGHGGGVTVSECCMHCGCRKFTDTWAQDPSNGTEGHETVAYTPGHYSDALREREGQDDEATQRADHENDEAKDRAIFGEGY